MSLHYTMTRKVAQDTLNYIEAVLSNLSEEDEHLPLINIREVTKRYIMNNNEELLKMIELGKHQLFYLNMLQNYNWISTKELASKIKEHHTTIARHLNALVEKGYLKTSNFNGITYYKVKK